MGFTISALAKYRQEDGEEQGTWIRFVAPTRCLTTVEKLQLERNPMPSFGLHRCQAHTWSTYTHAGTTPTHIK